MDLTERIKNSTLISPLIEGGIPPSWSGAIVYRDEDVALISECPKRGAAPAARDKSELDAFRNLMPLHLWDRIVEAKFLGVVDGRSVFEQPWLVEWHSGEEGRIDLLLADPDYIEFLEAARGAVVQLQDLKPWMDIAVDIPSPEDRTCGQNDIRLRPDGSWCLNDPIAAAER